MFRSPVSFPLRRLLVLCIAVSVAGILYADDFWKNKPRSEWSLKQTLKLLEDSPWARQESRGILRPEDGLDPAFDRTHHRCDPDSLDPAGNCVQVRSAAPTISGRNPQTDVSIVNDVVFLVRWESSAPIEDAFARLAELGERATAQYLSMPPRLPPDRFVVTLKALEKSAAVGSPSGAMPADPIGQIEADSAGPRARLSVGNLSVVPVETERSGVGAAEAVHFYFPRQVDGAPLIPLDRPSRVTFEFRGQRFSLKTRFSLTPDMVR